MEQFKSIEELLSSDISLIPEGYTPKPKKDRVLRSTRIEQAIFDDLHDDGYELAEIEDSGAKKLKSFKSLVNDVFQSVYGIKPKYTDEGELSDISKTFNKSIIADLMKDDNFNAVKSVCEGKELPAISATAEFTGELLDNLDQLMDKAVGGRGKIDALDKMEQDKQMLIEKLSKLLDKRDDLSPEQRELNDGKIINTANRLLAKKEQSEMFSGFVERSMKQSSPFIRDMIANAAASALDGAKTARCAVMAWGSGDPDMRKTPMNTEILKRCAGSAKLRYIAEFLGQYREMLNSKRLLGYRYGAGEKYDIEYGNNISKALTSELAMLATPELVPLFLKKYNNKALKQYRKREPVYKGKGDVIVCLDESGSTFGENNAYGMAIAMVLYELCRVNNTDFALVHFSTETKVDYFPKDRRPTAEQVMNCAETFLNGGTDFVKPLEEVMSIVRNARLKDPDVVFITDGECKLPDCFIPVIRKFKADTGMKLTGILLDKGSCIEFTLREFADTIYRTSELLKQTIAEELINERI